MRRKVFAAVALIALVACGVALASANNSYSGSYTIKATGSTKKPVATGMVEKLKVTAPTTPAGARGGYPLKDIDTSIAGLKASNGKYFKTCSAAQINNAGNSKNWNAVCNKSALVASGTVQAILGNQGNLESAGSFECSLGIVVYNAGAGKLTYFLTVPKPAKCDNLTTGTASAWTGTVKESGTTLVNNVPEPADTSTEAGNLPLWASLQTETLTWKKLTVKKSGKTYPFLESIGCKANKHSYSTKFTATNGSTSTSDTVKGSSTC